MNEEKIFGLGALAVLVALFIGLYYLSEEGCMVKGQSFDDVSFSLVGGCMVKHNNKWLPLDNIRGFDDK